MQERWDILASAQAAGVAAARVGSPARAVDAAARDVLDAAGLGACFVHRTGHGLGLDAIEAPAVSQDNDTPLEAGMLITVEPGVYFADEFGFRLEDTIHLAAAGPEILTTTSRTLEPLA